MRQKSSYFFLFLLPIIGCANPAQLSVTGDNDSVLVACRNAMVADYNARIAAPSCQVSSLSCADVSSCAAALDQACRSNCGATCDAVIKGTSDKTGVEANFDTCLRTAITVNLLTYCRDIMLKSYNSSFIEPECLHQTSSCSYITQCSTELNVACNSGGCEDELLGQGCGDYVSGPVYEFSQCLINKKPNGTPCDHNDECNDGCCWTGLGASHTCGKNWAGLCV